MLTTSGLPFSIVYGRPAHPLPRACGGRASAAGHSGAHRDRLERDVAPHVLLADHDPCGGRRAAFLAKEIGETLATAYIKQGSRLHDHTENGDMAFMSAV